MKPRETAQGTSPAPATATAAAELKERLADELAMLARDMASLQATLSEVLAAGRPTADQVRQLQDLDRATQMLDNLQRVATALAAAHPQPVDARELDALVTLADLRDRLAGVARRPAAAGEGAGPDADDVAWL